MSTDKAEVKLVFTTRYRRKLLQGGNNLLLPVKATLAAVAEWADWNTGITSKISAEQLAQGLGCHRTTVVRHIKAGVEAGWLEIAEHGGKRSDGEFAMNSYRLLIPEAQIVCADAHYDEIVCADAQSLCTDAHSVCAHATVQDRSFQDRSSTTTVVTTPDQDQTPDPEWFLWEIDQNRKPRWEFTGQTLRSPTRPPKAKGCYNKEWFDEDSHLFQIEKPS